MRACLDGFKDEEVGFVSLHFGVDMTLAGRWRKKLDIEVHDQFNRQDTAELFS